MKKRRNGGNNENNWICYWKSSIEVDFWICTELQTVNIVVSNSSFVLIAKYNWGSKKVSPNFELWFSASSYELQKRAANQKNDSGSFVKKL